MMEQELKTKQEQRSQFLLSWPQWSWPAWLQPTQKPKQERVHEQAYKVVPKLKLKTVYATNIEMYYWAPSIKNLQVGHLALRIIDDEEDIYISHWPKGQKVKFTFDLEDEGRSPDEYLLIPERMIYVDRVKQWWRQFLKDAQKGTEDYNLIVNNCAQVVHRALRAGSFPHHLVLYHPTFTPYGVKEWVKGYSGVEFKKVHSPASFKK